jgi:hypothetical protein
MITYKDFHDFCDVAKMAIIHKNKFTIFGYKKVMELETCLNPSILWLVTIVYYKTLMI